MKYSLIFSLFFVILISCNKDKDVIVDSIAEIDKETILNHLARKYQQLPEKEITISENGRFYAQYAMPTKRYGHAILGDEIEAGQLVVVADSVFYEFTLSDNYVFEDIRPRMYDVDNDNVPEIITIRTSLTEGGGIAIYKIKNKQLIEYAVVKEIGRSYRWLNIVAINDFDNDGKVELAWIETPHIGGILKVAKIEAGTLQVLAKAEQYSNHAIGERNLYLSVLTQHSDIKVIYVPNQNRNKIVGFTFQNNSLEIFEEISQTIDFSKPLITQYNFINTIDF